MPEPVIKLEKVGNQHRIIENSLKKLDNWLKKNGWAGYDPYDVKGLPFFVKIQRSGRLANKILRRLLFEMESIAPVTLRRILRVRKRINAKAMGLFAISYLNLYIKMGNPEHFAKVKQILSWLEENYSKGYSGKCWGHPFDWQSKIFIPESTPSGVVTSICGQAFYAFYQYTKEKKYLNICESICDFFLNDLNIDKLSPDKICFSYTPIDNFHINNNNLFVAEFLIRVGKEVKNEEFIQQGLKAVNYTLSEQNEDGSICYTGKDQDKNCRIDHYHTGFEIRTLYSIWKLLGEERIHKAVSKYYRFYLDNLFKDKTIPKITPQKSYPVNIHSCAESILCNSLLQNDFSEGKEYLENSLNWTIKNMQTKEGWFIYMLRNIKGIKYKIKIPFIRWSQAWMLMALSQYYLNYYKCNSDT